MLLTDEDGDPRKTMRREFSPEFKREAVALLESNGRPQMQGAAELGIQPSWLEERAGDPEREAIASAGRAGRRVRVSGDGDGRSGVRERQAPAEVGAHAHGARRTKKTYGPPRLQGGR